MKSLKKLVLAITIVACTQVAQAQEKTTTTNLKSKRGENILPEKGDWAVSFSADGILEYVGNAFNGDTGNDAPDFESPAIENTLVGKYFITDKSAYRITFNIGIENDKNFLSIANQTSNGFTDTDNKETDITLGFGKEWRRGKTRLQGFYGADLLIGASKNKGFAKTFNATTNDSLIVEIDREFTINFGAQGFIGAEYYILPKMALVAQYTYGIKIQPNRDVTIKATEFEGATNTTTISESKGSSSESTTGISTASLGIVLHF
jgi:hypothetical protein